MSLFKLTRMAKLAIDEHESGDPDAAAELRAFCLAQVPMVAEAFGRDPAAVRRSIDAADVAAFPALLLTSCKLHREHLRSAKAEVRTQNFDELVTRLAATSKARSDGCAYELDSSLLAGLAATAKTTHAILVVGTGETRVPLRPLRELAKVHAPFTWNAQLVKMGPVGPRHAELPGPIAWSLYVQWSERGRWRAGHCPLPHERLEATFVHVAGAPTRAASTTIAA